MTASNALSAFTFAPGNALRVMGREAGPLFIAQVVCTVLTISNTAWAVEDLDDGKGLQIVNTPGGPQRLTVVAESGLYDLIMSSNKPEAQRFRK